MTLGMFAAVVTTLIAAYLLWADRRGRQRHPPTVWFGRWRMDFDGLRETRASVAQSPAGYLPGLEVSYQGGDCDVHYGEAVPTLEEAVAVAKERESNWHQADD